ncbi:R-spondin-2 isoform 1-T1 [Ciconia maguari]
MFRLKKRGVIKPDVIAVFSPFNVRIHSKAGLEGALRTGMSGNGHKLERGEIPIRLKASYGPNPICKGCLSCSKDNGCIRCQHKLFFFLRREGMRQYGECLHSCPSGYYGLRTPDMNRCSRCRIENCDSCFSRDFCTKCKTGFYSHRGRCFRGCPPGFAALEELMECVEGCEVGQWSEWGTCSRNNKTCGFKWGLETRTRQIVKKPVKDTIPCPTIAESRRCKMAMRHCPGGRRPTKTKDKKKKKKNLMERAQKQHSIFLATDKTSQ